MKRQLILCIALLASPLLAQESKDPIDLEMDAALAQSATDGAVYQATAEAHSKWEAKMNAVYQSLKREMLPQEFTALQQAQRAWLEFREKQGISLEATFKATDGSSMWVPMETDAAMQITKNRTKELEKILEIVKIVQNQT